MGRANTIFPTRQSCYLCRHFTGLRHAFKARRFVSLFKHCEHHRVALETVILTSVLMLCPGFTGCAGYGPVVLSESCFGVGWFRRLNCTERPDYDLIEVEGVGILAVPNCLMLGYADYSRLEVCEPASADFRLRMSKAEFAIGSKAQAWASEINDGSAHAPQRIPEKGKELQR